MDYDYGWGISGYFWMGYLFSGYLQVFRVWKGGKWPPLCMVKSWEKE